MILYLIEILERRLETRRQGTFLLARRAAKPRRSEQAMICRVFVLAVGLIVAIGFQCFAQERAAKQPQTSTAPAQPGPAEIQKLIDQLGSGSYVERQAASNRLREIGEPAWSALRKAALSDDLEVRRRAARLAKDIGEKTFKELRRFGTGGGYWLNRVAFTQDGRQALATGGGVILYDLQTGKELHRTMELSFARLGLSLSKDSRYFLTGHQDDKVVRLGDVQTGKEVQAFNGHTAGVHGVALSPDGALALSGGNDATLRLWDVKTGKELRQFQGVKGKVRCVAFAADGEHALSGHFGGGGDSRIHLWEVKTGKLVRRLEGHEKEVTTVAFLPDDRTILSASLDGTLRLWDSQSGKEVRRMEHAGGVYSAALAPDGRRALSAGFGDKKVRLWDLAEGSEIYCFEGHAGAVLGVAFSPDGRQALSSDADNTIRLWRLLSPDPAPEQSPPKESSRPGTKGQ
jgi:WD40 repeat protein